MVSIDNAAAAPAAITGPGGHRAAALVMIPVLCLCHPFTRASAARTPQAWPMYPAPTAICHLPAAARWGGAMHQHLHLVNLALLELDGGACYLGVVEILPVTVCLYESLCSLSLVLVYKGPDSFRQLLSRITYSTKTEYCR